MIEIKTIMSMKEIIVPAMARPRGSLKQPIIEKIAPKNQTTQFTPGTQQKRKEMRARTNPAVPSPLDLDC